MVVGEDLTSLKDRQFQYLQLIGASTKTNDRFFDLLVEIVEALDSDCSDELVDKIDKFISLSEEFVRSQPGLENIKTDKTFRHDEANDEFFELYDNMRSFSHAVADHPHDPSAYFNDARARVYAHFTILLLAVSKRAVEVRT